MSNSPIVSIVVAVFNMKEHIRQCIDSVLGQSVQDIELILVDDVSTDGTDSILKEYLQRDSRVKVVWQKENAGAQVARNAGIAVSRGRYITTLDHDDFLHPQAIEYAINAFGLHSDVHCVCFREQRLLPSGEIIEHKQTNSFGLITGEEAYRRSVDWHAITGRMVVTRELQMRIPFDNCERVYGEDNTAQLQFLASPMVASCEGIYYHRLLHTSLSHKVSLNNIRGNTRFVSMRQQLIASSYPEEILRINESAFWKSIVGSYHYYYLHRKQFSKDARKEALMLIKTMRDQCLMHLVNPSCKYKPGRWHMPSWKLFTLQLEILLAIKYLIKGYPSTLQ